MNLFMDTSNNKLILILEEKTNIIDILIVENAKKISDHIISDLQNFLLKHNLTIKDTKKLYVINGPGSYTGVRLGITIAKTLKTINPEYEVYTLSSLHYQAGLKKAISLIDARGEKLYLGIYENGKQIIVDQLIISEYLDEFAKQFADFEILKDYKEIDFKKNFLDLKPFFKLEKNLEEINPVYIKDFIQ